MKTRLTANQNRLLQLYDRHAETLVRDISSATPYTARVKRILLQELRNQSPGIEIVALHLDMSVRSLQMKLKHEGTTYQQILNSLRKSLAIAYLQDPRVSKGEIAHVLGFSEISVFSRTFKKWTGKSPSEYQAALI
ncbi:MAG: helix-turn-helix domain-containing protein [Bacteroidota bacterium]